MANMNSNPQPAASHQPPNQFATGMHPGMGPGIGGPPMGGQYNTMQMGAGANPFASGMGGGYQNPNHNRPNYQTGFNDNNPFGAGPSAESW